MESGDRVLRSLALAAGVALVAACSALPTAATLDLAALPVYASAAVSVPFTVSGAEAGWTYRAVVARRTGAEYVVESASDLAAPASGAGAVDMTLVDGEYRLDLGVLAPRGVATYEIEYLARTAFFVVDTAAPEVPAASVAAGTYSQSFQVFLSHPELATGGAVYYTVDGTDPVASATRVTYGIGAPIQVGGTANLRAVASDAAGNYSTLLDLQYTFTVPPAPVITGISPASLNVDTDSNATLTITGTGFSSDTAVSIPAPGIVKSWNVYSNTTTIVAVVDVTGLASGGQLVVTATTAAGADPDNSVGLVNGAAPVISSITPATLDITTDNDATLTIGGSGFSADSGVSIPAPGVVKSVYVASATRIFAVVDVTLMAAGPLGVTVSAATGSDSDGSVTLTVPGAPTITRNTPATQNVYTGNDTTLSITGTNFTSGATVQITAPGVVKSTYVASSTSIFAVVDVAGVAAGPLTVTVNAGGGPVANNALVTVVSAPVITSLSPGSGSVTNATFVVDIYGFGFSVDPAPVAVEIVSGITQVATSVVVFSSTHVRATFNLTTLAAGAGTLNMNLGVLGIPSRAFTLDP